MMMTNNARHVSPPELGPPPGLYWAWPDTVSARQTEDSPAAPPDIVSHWTVHIFEGQFSHWTSKVQILHVKGSKQWI